MSRPRRIRRLSARLAACLLGLAFAAGPTSSQPRREEQTYCSVTKVTVEQFSNMVRVHLRADGLVRPRGEWRRYWHETDDGWEPLPTRRFGFRLLNARSKVGSFVNIGKYPISHLELTVPPEAEQGVGLEVTAVTYRPGELRRAGMPGLWEWMPVFGDRVQVDMMWDDNQRGMTIRGLSDRSPHATKAEEVVAEEPEDSEIEVTERNGGVKLSCLNAPWRQIFYRVGEAAGTDVVVSGDVQGYGSVRLPFLPVGRLLRVLCDAWGLALSRQPEGYVVRSGVPTSAASYDLIPTQRLAVRHLEATEALGALPNFLERYVYVDAQNNDLVTTAPPALLGKIRRDLARIDRPAAQIELEASLVQARRDVDWRADLGLTLLDGELRSASESASGDLVVGIAEGWPEDFQVRLRALQEAGAVSARSAPKVMVKSGEEAQVFVGERQFYIGLAGWRRQEVVLRSTDVGVRLRTSPWTGDGHHIAVPLHVEANTIVGTDESGAPLLSVSRVRCALRVVSGETIFVGGMTLAESTRTRRRVPILGQLPLVGAAFSSSTTSRRQSELGLFLTARAAAANEGVDAADAGVLPAGDDAAG